MYGLAGKFQRRRDSDFEQETSLTTSPKNDRKISKYETGAEYMDSSRWAQMATPSGTPSGHVITFEGKSSNKRKLLCLLITVSVILLLLIIALIVGYVMKVLIIKLPRPSSKKYPPYPYVTLNPLTRSTFRPFFPPYPGPLPSYEPATPSLPPPSDQLRSRTFLCQMYILNQANKAYTNHNRYEYREASQMILNAIQNELKQSSLQPYLENVQVWNLRDSGSDLVVEFSIVLLVPSHALIGASTVKNVLLSILPRIEMQLNGIRIDRNSISVRYLDIQG